MADAEVFPEHHSRARTALGTEGCTTLSQDRIDAVAQALANAEVRGENRHNGRVRVLRVLEYVYPSTEAMVEDMGNWGVQSMRRMGGTRITSTVLPPEVLS